MSKICHFFDLDCLINSSQQAWVVDKNNPNQPLYKIPISEFRLLKSGIYAKNGNKMNFNGVDYYLPDKIWNKLKVISSKYRVNFSDMVISLQEFLNKDLIDEMKFDLDLNRIISLKNKMEDIYIICSEQTRRNYEKIITQIEDELNSQGIKIKNFYYLNQNFLNKKSDELVFKQLRILLQHATGYKSENDKFIDEQITKYDSLNYYSKSIDLLTAIPTTRHLLNYMISNSDKGLSDVLKEDIKEEQVVINFHKIQDNQFNPLKTVSIELSTKVHIRKFESFNNLRFYP